MHPQIKLAQEYATRVHAAQTYDQYPYFHHLEAVYNVLIRAGFKEDDQQALDILTAAWLHDALEDTTTSYSDLKKLFGLNVAEMVFCVTDELGRNRKERHAKTYPKVRSNTNAIILKLADRVANMLHSISTDNRDKLKMYIEEFPEFQTQLRLYKHADVLWDDLTGIYTSHVYRFQGN
jgi:(p)ppGpp synthase/HD superfamily hydrolase